MTDQKERLKKLYALAMRGVGGEKETAQAILEKLLKKYAVSLDELDEGVESLSYEYDDGTAEEYCVIRYKNNYTRRVCITADSEKAITNDVLKVI